MERVQNLFCVTKAISKAQKPADLVKVASFKRFEWWSTTSHGKQAIAEHKVIAFTDKREALAAATARLKMLKEDWSSAESSKDPFKTIKVTTKSVKAVDMELTPDEEKARKDGRPTKQAYSDIASDKFDVPRSVTSALEKKIKVMNDLLDDQMEREPNWCQYYMTAVAALSELLEYLKAGSEAEFKKAVLKMYSFMNLIYLEIPDEVVLFLHGSGGLPNLKDYYYKEVKKKDEERFKEVPKATTIVEPEKSKAPK